MILGCQCYCCLLSTVDAALSHTRAHLHRHARTRHTHAVFVFVLDNSDKTMSCSGVRCLFSKHQVLTCIFYSDRPHKVVSLFPTSPSERARNSSVAYLIYTYLPVMYIKQQLKWHIAAIILSTANYISYHNVINICGMFVKRCLPKTCCIINQYQLQAFTLYLSSVFYIVQAKQRKNMDITLDD